ncbi:MAG TPA: hypothetical protein VNU19_23695 [Candidatus Acidoferrum sp.]|nr:hypothetical protein [Candidatus Acidoferrum sp.]
MRHLQSQSSLPAAGKEKLLLSPLAKKLRLQPDHHVAIINAPEGYIDGLAPAPTRISTDLQPPELFDAVQLFVNGEEELRDLGPSAIRAVKPDGILWVTYPNGERTRGVTDLPASPEWIKQDVLGEITSEFGYKPVALVKIDDHWTALRFTRLAAPASLDGSA